MLQIDALPAFSDNYIWLLQDTTNQRCAVVDPGDAAPVLDWLALHPDWVLSDILITHHHFDHVGGVRNCMSTLTRRSGDRHLRPFQPDKWHSVTPTASRCWAWNSR